MPARHLTDSTIDYAKRDAKILALHEDHGLSYREIADRYGLTRTRSRR